MLELEQARQRIFDCLSTLPSEAVILSEAAGRILAEPLTAALDLPPVRMGLLTKLNLLTVGLIFLAAVTITAFVFWRQWQSEERQLHVQGETIARMLADLSESGVRTGTYAGGLRRIIHHHQFPELNSVPGEPLRGQVTIFFETAGYKPAHGHTWKRERFNVFQKTAA